MRRPAPLLAFAALALLALAMLARPAAAQVVVPDTTAADSTDAPLDEAALEALAEDDAAADPTDLLELLTQLRANPLDVNRATAEELAQVPALNLLLADAIVRYRAENGDFGSLPELQLVDGMTAETYALTRPYLTIGAPLASGAERASPYPAVPRAREVWRGLAVQATQRFQRRLDTARGYEGPDSLRTYPGSPVRAYTRVLARFRRNVSAGVTLEKDPGEAFRWEPDANTYGYDFASAHLAVLRVGRIDALVVGDFVAEFGQGVALWRAAGFGKGPDAASGPVRAGRGLRPYASVEENRFFRGVGATVALTPQLYATAFASRRAYDASLAEVDTTGGLGDPDLPPQAEVTSLGLDGLHRTPRELERKDALGQTLGGGALEARLVNRRYALTAGVVGYHARFDDPLAAGTRPDNRFNFAGDALTMVSAYADARSAALGPFPLRAFGEVARAPGGAVGGLGGVQAELGPAAQLLVLGRHFPRDFTSLHGYPFGERNGAGQNETGLYAGLRVRPTRTWTLAAYLDQYRFPWLRFNEPRPTVGHEALGVVEHRPRPWLRWTAQARTETRETGLDVPNRVPGSTVEGLTTETRQTLRFQGEYDASRAVRLRTRIEGARYRLAGEPAELGMLLYQDLRYQALRWLRLDTRLTFFETDSYSARVYQYENDLTGVFAVPALSGRGVRAYALVTLTPIERLSIQAKLAGTVYQDVRRLGSGADTIEGDRVRDLGLQVRYTF